MNSPNDIRHSENPARLNWLRRFLSCNPLYLASAGLLLYGVNQLTSDARISGTESAQITFNFSALFIYEILLVCTAIMLARRRIWYDALLLVGLENLFVLIPFSFVSRAVQLEGSLGRNLCVAAVLLAVLKFWALRRYIPQLNFPQRLLAFGGLIIAANVALALGLRRILNEPHAVNSWLTFGWLVGMPALIALVNLLPKSTNRGESLERRAWLPHATLGIWVVVTGCHLAGTGYVFTFNWSLALMSPGLWAMAWTLLLQTGALGSAINSRRMLLAFPFLATIPALNSPKLFLALNLLNAVGFALAWRRNRTHVLIGLSFLGVVIGTANLPADWVSTLLPHFNRTEWAFACVAIASVAAILISRNPRWALVGGCASTVAAAMIADHAGGSMHWALQTGLVFVTIHSLRWRDSQVPGAATARMITCVLWVASSLLWTLSDERAAVSGCYIFGGSVLACYGLRRLLNRDWSPLIVPLSAMSVILLRPALGIGSVLDSISPGYLAVTASFALFALGTFAALTKHRWQRRDQIRPRETGVTT